MQTDVTSALPYGFPRHPSRGWQPPRVYPEVVVQEWTLGQILLWLGVHVAFAFALRNLPFLGLVQSLTCLFLGLRWLAQGAPLERLIALAGYVTAMEILWRGTDTVIVYEFAKYTVCLILLLAALRYRLLASSHKLPLLYFALLLPSILVLPEFDREEIAFNLTGPMTLAVATCFFSTQKLTLPQLKKVLLVMLGPAVGLCALASILSLSAEVFIVHGKAGSAGFAPNQVSSILGMGAILAFTYQLLERRSRPTRALMFGLLLWFLAQSAVTLSRGGLWAALGGIAAASFFLLRDRQTRAVLVLRFTLVAVLGIYWIFPFANTLTGGILGERLTSFDATGRDRIVAGDFMAFHDHPLLGVGPGQSTVYHERTFRASSAHTEYSRLLSEHGSMGALALLILLGICARRALRPLPLGEKALVAGFTTWALLFMLHAAMRMAAPGFLFGLAAARFYALPNPQATPAARNARP